MPKHTPLHDCHLAANALMADFAGWHMPMHYGSQIQEHHAVRQQAGMFDVSHMNIVDLEGPDCRNFLRFLLANDIDKIKDRSGAIYSCMLNDKGGVVDDLIVYWLGENYYRLVLNAATYDKDLAFIRSHLHSRNVTLSVRDDLAMIALQGPQALKIFQQYSQSDFSCLAYFSGTFWQESWWVARTGYTGEDGLEIMLPAIESAAFWRALLSFGVQPCGLGARDTLRLEAGLSLYGHEMDDHTSPLVANLAWTVAWQPESRQFIGRAALEAEKKAGISQQLVGVIMRAGGVLRDDYSLLLPDGQTGKITSGGFSPTLGCAIALARVPMDCGNRAIIDRRGKQIEVELVRPPFVRKGQAVFKELVGKEIKHAE